MTRLSIRLLPGRSFELPPPHLELKAQARGNAFQMPPLPTFVQVVPHDQSGRVGLLTLTASGAALPPWSRRSTRRRPTRPRESLAPRSYPPSVRLASSSGKGKGPQRGPLELQGWDLNPRPPGYEPGELPDCSTPRRCPCFPCARPCSRAGNGTRTRDPNLGKVVLYQLSYSRERWDNLTEPTRDFYRSTRIPPPCPSAPSPRLPPDRWLISGGEGDRTPDLVNAIHALSQLSYAPPIILSRLRARRQHENLAAGSPSVK